MAKYKDPEERLEDIEHIVKHIQHTVDSMQRRAMIMTLLRLFKLVAIGAIMLWVYHGLQPFVESIGSATVKAQNNVEKFNNSVDSLKGFFGVENEEE